MVKIGIIGSTNSTGRALIDKLLAKEQHTILALAPSAKEFPPHDNLTIVEGSHDHGPDILKLVKGGKMGLDREHACDVVVLCLADLISARGIKGEAMTPAVVSLLVAKPARIIVVTANGCNAPLSQSLQRTVLGGMVLGCTMPGAYCSFKDMQQADTLVQQSMRQSWLLVRPNNLREESGKYSSTWSYEATTLPGLRMGAISTRDVAHFIADHVDDKSLDNKPVHLHRKG